MDANKMGTYIEVSEEAGLTCHWALSSARAWTISTVPEGWCPPSRQPTRGVRVMGTCFATGHAAGVAAACQALHGEAPAEAVRAELEKQGALL